MNSLEVVDMSTSPLGEEIRPGMFTLRRVAAELGMSPENLRALDKRGRLPEGCEPALDELTGTRYWTPDQVRRLKDWNDERQKALAQAEGEAETDAGDEARPEL